MSETYEFIVKLEFRGSSTGWTSFDDALDNGVPAFAERARKEARTVAVEVRRVEETDNG